MLMAKKVFSRGKLWPCRCCRDSVSPQPQSQLVDKLVSFALRVVSETNEILQSSTIKLLYIYIYSISIYIPSTYLLHEPEDRSFFKRLPFMKIRSGDVPNRFFRQGDAKRRVPEGQPAPLHGSRTLFRPATLRPNKVVAALGTYHLGRFSPGFTIWLLT